MKYQVLVAIVSWKLKLQIFNEYRLEVVPIHSEPARIVGRKEEAGESSCRGSQQAPGSECPFFRGGGKVTPPHSVNSLSFRKEDIKVSLAFVTQAWELRKVEPCPSVD